MAKLNELNSRTIEVTFSEIQMVLIYLMRYI